MRLIVDTDAGSDDAVALMMALRSPEVVVEGITVVAGNVPLEQAVQNALYTVELCGSSAPVYSGLAKPLLRPLETAQFVHGEDGMGDLGLPLSGRQATGEHAVDVLVRELSRPDPPTLVCLGPLSNLAVALLRAPELAESTPHCVIMGGAAVLPGNVTPLAEYNVWADPEAAKIVFESGMRITMVGWEMSHRFATIDPATEAEIRGLHTELARLAMDIQHKVAHFARTETGLAGFDLPDPLTMAVVLEPDLATRERRPVTVLTADGQARGQTMVDLRRRPGEGRVEITTHVDRQGFLDRLKRVLSSADPS